MDKYAIKLTNGARKDLEGIFRYVTEALQEPKTAQNLIDTLESEIMTLTTMPNRCPERRRGIYANKGYRQLLVKNYTVIFKVEEDRARVRIVTIRYSRSNF